MQDLEGIRPAVLRSDGTSDSTPRGLGVLPRRRLEFTRYALRRVGTRHVDMVRKRGLEPLRPFGHWTLNPARLPIPPLPHVFRSRGGYHRRP